MNKDKNYSENKSWSEAREREEREREREREQAAAVCPAPGVPLTNQHNSPRINYHQRKGGGKHRGPVRHMEQTITHTDTHKHQDFRVIQMFYGSVCISVQALEV